MLAIARKDILEVIKVELTPEWFQTLWKKMTIKGHRPNIGLSCYNDNTYGISIDNHNLKEGDLIAFSENSYELVGKDSVGYLLVLLDKEIA